MEVGWRGFKKLWSMEHKERRCLQSSERRGIQSKELLDTLQLRGKLARKHYSFNEDVRRVCSAQKTLGELNDHPDTR